MIGDEGIERKYCCFYIFLFMFVMSYDEDR